MLVADTSALYGLFDAADPHHAAARAEFRRGRSTVVPSEILAEVVGLLEDRLGAEDARTALLSLHRLPHLRIAGSSQRVVAAAVAGFLDGGPLSFEDLVFVATCRATGATPWSYDRKLLRACRA